jgi:hypothetical protein
LPAPSASARSSAAPSVRAVSKGPPSPKRRAPPSAPDAGVAPTLQLSTREP